MAAASELAHRKKLRREWKPPCDLDDPDMVVAPTCRNLGTEKCISGEPSSALADFLAKASLTPPASVIFDNPINSLNYKRMAEVVDRIVESSETRKVIVFTHNILTRWCFMNATFVISREVRSTTPPQPVWFHLRMQADT